MVDLRLIQLNFKTLVTKLQFACQGKEFGGTFGQRPTKSDSNYHSRLYQEAQAQVHSKVWASSPEKRDVRFSVKRPENMIPRESLTSQERNTFKEHCSSYRARDEQLSTGRRELDHLSNADRMRENRPLSERRRHRQSLLLHNIPEFGKQPTPGSRTLLD